MGEEVNWKDFKGAIERNIHFAKGDSGRVLIVAGEAFLGATVFAAHAALRAGVDSVYVLAPAQLTGLLSATNPDLVVLPLPPQSQAAAITARAGQADVLLIGPGFGVGPEQKKLLAQVLPGLKTKLVIDADATKQAPLAALKGALILANASEYEALGEPAPGENVLVVKGPVDLIISKNHRREVPGGHPRATVNGTGDVLAGLAAGLFAQMDDCFLTAQAASYLLKQAAETVGGALHYGWLASDLLDQIPKTLYEYRLFRTTKHQPTAMKRAIKRGRSLWTWRSEKTSTKTVRGEKQKKGPRTPADS
ncbi:NAD(P)H-hydrate dehydratase [Candidatus Woesearchaeota archaeon]|nr:MAG: NAD(P)H-hydrate dehydratase [Candidatus Woesearchaeota archaeon]